MVSDRRKRRASPAERIRVPSPDTPWSPEVVDFALSYNGYERHGGNPGAGKIANDLLRSWEETGRLVADLPTLRCALFFEQRRAHHVCLPPDADYLRALLVEIQRLSGGWVEGPAEEFF